MGSLADLAVVTAIEGMIAQEANAAEVRLLLRGLQPLEAEALWWQSSRIGAHDQAIKTPTGCKWRFALIGLVVERHWPTRWAKDAKGICFLESLGFSLAQTGNKWRWLWFVPFVVLFGTFNFKVWDNSIHFSMWYLDKQLKVHVIQTAHLVN